MIPDEYNPFHENNVEGAMPFKAGWFDTSKPCWITHTGKDIAHSLYVSYRPSESYEYTHSIPTHPFDFSPLAGMYPRPVK